MAVSNDPLRRDAITVQASDPGDRLVAPTTNPALALASSLANIQPDAAQALQGYADSEQAKLAAQARKDALVTSGQPLAEAVREGKIDATQNPWYMEAYAREGAAIRSTAEFNQLHVDAASWPEQNDPKAFAQRWADEAGVIAEHYTGKDEIHGFAPVEAQATQQALATNVAANIQRIKTERTNNLGVLAANAISLVAQQNGGQVTGAQAAAALDPAKRQFIGTGGTEEEWQQLALNAITTSAYDTKNPGLLYLSKAPELVGGAGDGTAKYGDGTNLVDPSTAVHTLGLPASSSLQDGTDKASIIQKVWPALIQQESGGNQAARSLKGAGGVAQLLPSTAKEWATEMGQPELADIAFDHTQAGEDANNKIGQYGFGKLLDRFGGDVPKALAAYNAGPNRRFLAGPSSGADFINSIPIPETKNYVTSILKGSGIVGGQTPTAVPDAPPTPPPPANPGAPTGQPSLYDRPGVAADIETAHYRIAQAQEEASTSAVKQMEAQRTVQAYKAQDDIYSHFGTAALTGAVKPEDMVAYGTAQGYSPQVIGKAIGLISTAVNGLSSIQAASVNLKTHPEQAVTALNLAQEANTNPQPDFHDRLASQLLNGAISYSDARALQDQADATNLRNQKAATKLDAGRVVKTAQALKEHVASYAAAVAQKVEQVGGNTAGQTARIDPKRVRALNGAILQAAQAYLATHPGDYPGAALAAQTQAAAYGAQAVANITGQRNAIRAGTNHRRFGATPTASATTNPLRGQ